MGQKVSPISFRIGVIRDCDSRWFATKDYADRLHEDLRIRKFLDKRLAQASVGQIVIERPHRQARITIHTARPGIVIGKKGADLEKLRQDLVKFVVGELSLNVVELRKPDLNAVIVAESVARQLERRVTVRRAMKRAIQNAQRVGAGGIRINCAGRLGGAEIARTEWYREGRVPLHTLRADVDYGQATAMTTYGTCGVKVWIFRGEILGAQAKEERRMEMDHAVT
ncbi:MAG: 30S ribosomal protein S3 [Pseudomonadota bacterium]